MACPAKPERSGGPEERPPVNCPKVAAFRSILRRPHRSGTGSLMPVPCPFHRAAEPECQEPPEAGRGNGLCLEPSSPEFQISSLHCSAALMSGELASFSYLILQQSVSPEEPGCKKPEKMRYPSGSPPHPPAFKLQESGCKGHNCEPWLPLTILLHRSPQCCETSWSGCWYGNPKREPRPRSSWITPFCCRQGCLSVWCL